MPLKVIIISIYIKVLLRVLFTVQRFPFIDQTVNGTPSTMTLVNTIHRTTSLFRTTDSTMTSVKISVTLSAL